MLLKLFNAIRTDPDLFRRFVETNELSIERRITIARTFELSDEAIEAALAENLQEGERIIREQLERSFGQAGVSAVGHEPSPAEDRLRSGVDDLIAEIKAWDARFKQTAWPGGGRLCAESIAPAVVEATASVEYVIHGWLLDPRVNTAGEHVLGVHFCVAGKPFRHLGMATARVMEVVDLGHRRCRVRTAPIQLPDGDYDLVLTHDDLGGAFPDVKKSQSRLPGAVSVQESEF